MYTYRTLDAGLSKGPCPEHCVSRLVCTQYRPTVVRVIVRQTTTRAAVGAEGWGRQPGSQAFTR
jgi:hypothetical protein